MEVDTVPSTSVEELVSSLEQATLMASRIPAVAADPHQLHQIRSSLQYAHWRLSVFLDLQPPPPENQMAAAVGVAGEDSDVQMGDQEDEHNSRVAVDKVEESMRDCFIQNKRPKRGLSPSAAAVAEQRQIWENEGLRDCGVAAEYNPYTNKLSSLELIYQFHG